MVFHYEIEEHGCLFLHRRIEVFAREGLVDLSDTAFEGVVLFVGKPLAASKFVLQGVDSLHSILVGGAERFFLGRPLDVQGLIVVAVEGVEGIYIIANDIEESCIFALRDLVLEGECPRHQPHHVLQFVVMVQATLVDGIAFDEVLLDECRSPYSELCTIDAFYSITDRDDYVKVIECRFAHLDIVVSSTVSLGLCTFCTYQGFIQFSFLEDIPNVSCYYRTISSE